MQTRKIIVAVAIAGVLGLVVMLLWETQSDGRAGISEDKKARALAEYKRRTRLEQPAIEPDTAPSAATKPSRVRRTKKVETETAVEKPAPVMLRQPPTLAPSMTAAKLSLGGAVATVGSNSESPEAKERKDAVRDAYDTGNFPEAQRLSLVAIKSAPRDLKLLRYVVSSSCAMGELDTARVYAEKLPKPQRAAMAKRCKGRWGAEL